MRLYIDDDSTARQLVRLLKREGWNVVLPIDLGLSGADDPVHLKMAIIEQRVVLTGNHHDFKQLHELIEVAGGRHPGIFVVRRDNNPLKDMTHAAIVRSIRNVIAAQFAVESQFLILNHWRRSVLRHSGKR